MSVIIVVMVFMVIIAVMTSMVVMVLMVEMRVIVVKAMMLMTLGLGLLINNKEESRSECSGRLRV